MKSGTDIFTIAAMWITAILGLSCCADLSKLQSMKTRTPQAQVSISEEKEPLLHQINAPEHDTLIIKNVDGKEVTLMRAIKDEDGSMVANRVLEAAHVEARFRNVAERHGKVDIHFSIIVPREIRSSEWQLRYAPTLFIMGDSVALERVIITGENYRKRQLRGYQQYQRFLERIAADSLRLVNIKALEIFLRRNIPQVYAFRTDSSYVSDEAFYSAFGVTQQEAVDHYTNQFAVWVNRRRINSKDEKFRKWVKAPIITEGIRLDTVFTSEEGSYVYEYTQTIPTRPKLKKVEITLDGEIYRQEKMLCRIDRSKPLEFYISSVSAFVDDSQKYITRIMERRVEESSSFQIDFRQGMCDVDPELGNNRIKLAEIQDKLHGLLCNETFALDSINTCAWASPEGNYDSNRVLSRRRSEAICSYFKKYLTRWQDSLRIEKGFEIEVDAFGKGKVKKREGWQENNIEFLSSASAEAWEKLDTLIKYDYLLKDSAKEEYYDFRKIPDPDTRESLMSKCSWYSDMRERLYPQLRMVEFTFTLHRRGMVKDTVQTTEIDSVYMAGIRAIKDRDYDLAIELLRPYGDYNTAVAYCAKDYNYSALSILNNYPKTGQVNYMLALIQSRLGDKRSAVELYLRSCSQDKRFVHRGNLDPEISELIREYSLGEKINEINNEE